ncbi:DUF3144 domain-containing protein [Simiduia curdlanivorans]|uniref:DUF3144 domain-containing protein n=1 Tax=Simiduia curdlanivorans TaxID=1492769 RepID=A0ABV8V8Z0_9GAMM|nr:DUF3144 domain-containing protein [Simiduia curdlanivorans]MDN3638532.1 DUF3144 domain-containing protein [Simiduia curdlanivorans]
MAQQDDAFWALVEKFIEQANDAPETLGLTEVGGALLCAAARFNAYALAASSIDRKSFKEDFDQSLSDYSQQFKALLAEDLADYGENYKVLIGNKDEETDA